MSERIININGVLYVARENENGTYMQRVNADGSDWVEGAQYTQAEIASGIVIGGSPAVAPLAPTVVQVAPKRKGFWRRLSGWLAS